MLHQGNNFVHKKHCKNDRDMIFVLHWTPLIAIVVTFQFSQNSFWIWKWEHARWVIVFLFIQSHTQCHNHQMMKTISISLSKFHLFIILSSMTFFNYNFWNKSPNLYYNILKKYLIFPDTYQFVYFLLLTYVTILSNKKSKLQIKYAFYNKENKMSHWVLLFVI